jgi:hypothetical protein
LEAIGLYSGVTVKCFVSKVQPKPSKRHPKPQTQRVKLTLVGSLFLSFKRMYAIDLNIRL